MIYIMLGGPATGKGTRAGILSRELKIPHISSGSLLREASKENEEIRKTISAGNFVTDEVMNEIIMKKLTSKEAKDGFILDGYPRNLDQVAQLEEILRIIGKDITRVLELVAPRELVFKRILERKECLNCNRAYGIDFPSKDNVHCDNCGSVLVTRSDDTVETLTKRIETYEEVTKPLIEYYKERGLLKTVDSSNCPEHILDMI